MRRSTAAAFTALALGIAVASCGEDEPQRVASDRPATSQGTAPSTDEAPVETTAQVPVAALEFPRFEPAPEEKYPNAKQLAARVAQAATTYARGSTPRQVAEGIGASAIGVDALADVIAPLVDREARSGGEVVYPQLSGVTPTSLGTMVVVRQTKEWADGRRQSITRVLDIRLRRAGGPWTLDQVASVGGRERERPGNLGPQAQRVLEHPSITLSDSARWDIYSGRVDEQLLRTLADGADVRPISVGILISGHPENVWATPRRSAHSAGFAADIYAVGGQLVVRQQQVGSSAYRLTQDFLRNGARQIGSPWAFGPGTIKDDTHLDHVHVQARAILGTG